MGLEVSENLPPAVPPYEPNMEQAWMQIGVLSCQIFQLQREMQRRAVETNLLHDRFQSAVRLLHQVTEGGHDLHAVELFLKEAG